MTSIVIVVTSMTLSTVVVTMMVSTVVVVIMMVTMTRRREECHCPFPENLLHLLFSKKRLFCPILHPFSISRKSLLGQSEFKAFVFSTTMLEGSDLQDKKNVCRGFGGDHYEKTSQHCRLIITILDCDPTCSNERVSAQR